MGLNTISKPIEYAYKRPFTFDDVTMHLYMNAPHFSVNDDEQVSRAIQEEVLEFASEVIKKSLVRGKSIGGALVLVPSHSDLEMLVGTVDLGGRLPSRRLIAQDASRSLQLCISEFKRLSDPVLGLLAPTGAWRGVDLPGRALTELFIPRIPRSNPQDPQVIARQNARMQSHERYAAYRQKEGLDAKRYRDHKSYRGFFTEDVWKFKQGIGRLCRKEGDAGNIHLLDSRLFTDSIFKYILKWIEMTFTNIVKHS